MGAFEPGRAVSGIRNDYLEKLERSEIYEEFRSEIPKFDHSKNRYPVDDKKTKFFYKKLMQRVNVFFELPEKEKQKGLLDFLVFLLENLKKNHKLYKVAVKYTGPNKKTITPRASKELEEELENITDIILGQLKPEYSPRRRKGCISSLSGLLPLVLKALKGEKDAGYNLPTKTQVMKNVSLLDDDLPVIVTDLIAEVAVHHKVKEYFYNTSASTAKGNKKVSRNKTISRLEAFAMDNNFNETYDHVAFADKHSIYEIYRELLKKEEQVSKDFFLPVASDCFGNIIVISERNALISLFPEKRIKTKDFKLWFAILSPRYKKTQNNARINYTCANVYNNYEYALYELGLMTYRFPDSPIIPGNRFYTGIMNKYRKRADLRDTIDSKKFFDDCKKYEKELSKEMDSKDNKHRHSGPGSL